MGKMENSVKFIFFITIFLIVTCQEHQVTLFSSIDCTGNYVTVAGESPDLSSLLFTNRAYSVQLAGLWLFYQSEKYNTGVNSAMEYIFESTSKCVNFQGIGGWISSLRSPGSNGVDRITFYNDKYFQGIDEWAFADIPELKLRQIKSAIVTGSSGWTLYDDVKYSGNSVCVFPSKSGSNPDTFEPSLIHDTKDVNFPDYNIASVRKGCQE